MRTGAMADKKAAVAVLMLLSLVLTGAYADLKSEIEEAYVRNVAAFNSQDAETLSRYFTEDCTMMSPGSDVIQGRESIKELFNNMFKMGVASVMTKVDEVGPPDATDTLFERGHYTLFDTKGNIFDKGKHVGVWKKVAGVWLLDNYIYNSNQKSVLKEEISAVHKQYTEECAEQDAKGVASFYTCDGKLMGPEMDVIHGKEAIADFVQTIFDMGIAHVSLDTRELSTMGATEDSAYDRGYYTFSGAEGDVIEYGKYVILWKRMDGRWKIYVGIYNTNSSPSQSHDEL